MKKVKYVIWKYDNDVEIHKTVFDKPVSKQYLSVLGYDVPGYMTILYLFTIKFK